MPEPTHTLNLNLDAIRSESSVGLQKVINLVTSGLKALDAMGPASGGVPNNFFSFSSASVEWDTEKTKEEFSLWVLTNGFRDAIESMSNTLETTHTALRILKLMENSGKPNMIKGEHYNEQVVKPSKKFHRDGFPEKIEGIEKLGGFAFDENVKKHVISFNQARNCFVHRFGIVGEKDCVGSEEFTLSWRQMRPLAKRGEEEITIDGPTNLNAGDELFIRFSDQEKKFRIGDPLHVDATVFTDMTFTLWWFGDNIRNKIKEVAKAKGLIE